MSANGTSDEVVRSEPGLNHLKCVSLVQGVQNQVSVVFKSIQWNFRGKHARNHENLWIFPRDVPMGMAKTGGFTLEIFVRGENK